MKYSTPLLLTCVTGRLLCSLDELYKSASEFTHDDIFTHVLPRAMDFAKPFILQQEPDFHNAIAALPQLDELLEAVESNEGKEIVVEIWIASLGLEDSYEIEIDAAQWQVKCPIAEVLGMMGYAVPASEHSIESAQLRA